MNTELAATVTGEITLFRELAANLAFITKKDHVLLSQRVHGDPVKFVDSVAFWSHARFVDNIRYSLEGTPCKSILQGNAVAYPERVQAQFPHDSDLLSLNAESYLGCPIRSVDRAVIGHVAIIDHRPLTNAAELLTIAHAFASLAASEFDRVRMIEQVWQSERRYRVLYDSTPAIFFTVAQDNIVTSLNAFGVAQLGIAADRMVGRSLLDIVLPEDVETCRASLVACFADRSHVHGWTLRQRRRDGTAARYKLTARVIDEASRSCSLLIVAEDVTEAHARAELLTQQASHDSLTGLLNRREFESLLESLLSDERSASKPHALCYLDLDRFKIVNDRGGHPAGDELLRQLAQLLQEGIRKSDTLARIGGDEFVVLMRDCSLERAEQIAGSLTQRVLAHRFAWGGERFDEIGVSIGVVAIASPGLTLRAVLQAADTACYAAKKAGRGRVQVHRSPLMGSAATGDGASQIRSLVR